MTSTAGPDPDDVAEQALRWHVRAHSGHLTPEESRALAAWLADDPRHERAYRALDGVWRDAADLELDRGTGRLSAPGASGVVRRPGSRRALAAAVALMMVVAGLVLWRYGYGPGLVHDLATTVGERRVVRLADGTDVWLDARSVADVDYGQGHRGLVLHAGRAFVQVAPDPARPFTISAGDASVTALGTAFAVGRRGDHGVHVAVAEHAVAVRWRGRDVSRLAATRQLTIDRAGHAGPVTRIDRQAVGAWRQGRLIVEGLALGEVIERLADHRAAPILVADEAVARLPVSAVLDLDDIDGALAALASVLPIRLHGLGPLLTIVSRAER